MQEKSIIKQNILQFLESQGVSKYKFYQLTGITRGILNQSNGISEDNIHKIIAYYKQINPEWLLTGKGSMLREGVDAVNHLNNTGNYNHITQSVTASEHGALRDEHNALLKKYTSLMEQHLHLTNELSALKSELLTSKIELERLKSNEKGKE